MAIQKFCMGNLAHCASIHNIYYPWKQNIVFLEISILVGHDAASLENLFLTFVRWYSHSPSRVQMSKKNVYNDTWISAQYVILKHEGPLTLWYKITSQNGDLNYMAAKPKNLHTVVLIQLTNTSAYATQIDYISLHFIMY